MRSPWSYFWSWRDAMAPGQPQIVRSWGNVVRGVHSVYRPNSRFQAFPSLPAHTSILPFGNGRSYGDSCLNVGGALLKTQALDHFIQFDVKTGTLRCEAGVQLADILRLVTPQRWFPPVLPGTQYVTVGGVIANDVHGKNHHQAGTFGAHVRRLELLRSDGERIVCAPDQHPKWFAATVGGLGLTGLITWADIQLRPVSGPWMEVESVRCACLDELLERSVESAADFEYTVAWVDCAAGRRRLGRGLLQRANHAQIDDTGPVARIVPQLRLPFLPPCSLVNPTTLRMFNSLHYRRHPLRARSLVHYERFFFPLDRIHQWNRLYGPRGFYQYQCVVPAQCAREAVRKLLQTIASSGEGSFLAVLKCFADRPSPGVLSFPLPGVTLALDFPNRGLRSTQLFDRLDVIVSEANGRLYPAKDARMPATLFRSGYPAQDVFAQFTDVRCSSSFWRRVRTAA